MCVDILALTSSALLFLAYLPCKMISFPWVWLEVISAMNQMLGRLKLRHLMERNCPLICKCLNITQLLPSSLKSSNSFLATCIHWYTAHTGKGTAKRWKEYGAKQLALMSCQGGLSQACSVMWW